MKAKLMRKIKEKKILDIENNLILFTIICARLNFTNAFFCLGIKPSMNDFIKEGFHRRWRRCS